MITRVFQCAQATTTLLAVLMLSRAPGLSATTVAYWQFNERAAGTTASTATNAILDASGNGRHLTVAGSPPPQYTAASTNYGSSSALKFTSGTDRLYTAQTAAFNFGLSNSFTLEAVVRTTAGASFTGNIVGRDWGANLPSWWFRLDSGYPRFLVAQNGGPEPNVTATVAVNDGNWHHLAAVRDGTNRKLLVYVDYALAGETTDTTTTPPTNAQSLVVGAFNAGARQFEGEMDFVRISTEALSPAEFVLPLLSIVNLEATNGATLFSATNGLHFTVLSDFGVDAAAIRLTLNGSDRSSELAISGRAYHWDVSFTNLKADVSYTGVVSVADLHTNRVEQSFQFDTYVGHTTTVFARGDEGYNTYRIPALLVTAKGTVLAFAEARKNSGSDAGDIDLVVKRSTDNGRTWSAMTTVWEDSTNTIGNPCPVVDQSNGTIWMPCCRNNDRVFITKSTDDGVTWTTPVEITSVTKLANWTWYATGPGVGIQLARGTNAGRLVIPCDHNATVGTSRVAESHVIYSDDHGQTWQLGGAITPKVNECQVVELTDGRLLMNMRNSGSGQTTRALAYSPDGGLTWSEVTYDAVQIEPVCQASFLRYTLAADYGKSRLLFSNPASTSGRTNMTARLSYDEGKTWPVAKTLHAGPAAYSCLTVLPDLSLGCLYEAGVSSAYQTITFKRFSLAWLTDGVDRPNRRTLQLRPNGAQLMLDWPAEYAEASVEVADGLNVAPTWTTLATEPTVVEDRRQVVLSAAAPQRFFRLVSTNETTGND